MVQIGTQFGYEGTPLFDRLAKELREIMNQKGYTNINEFRGKLKTFDD